MSFMEHPQPDACRALMPTPENPPPGPPSRPIVCYMPKGHDETDGHAETRRPGPLARRWHGDARPPMTVVDRPDNGQDELVWVQLPADDVAFLRGFDPDRDRTASRADMVRVIEHLQDALASGRAGAGEQQRDRVMDALMYAIGQEMPMGVVWNLDRVTDRLISALPELLALLGGPQSDGEAGRG